MTLVLEIEHLLGVSFAAQSPANPEPDWPPQPDRVFSALVAAWGARGQRPEERRALEWLEAQPTPELSFSDGFRRSAATAFVPPNDPETGRVGNRSVMPAFRRRQPRRFPAFRPDDPVIRLIWRDLVPTDNTLTALNALARDTPYVGHSASMTRCRFTSGVVPDNVRYARRSVYPGRLAELARDFESGRRPGPGVSATHARVRRDVPPHSHFAGRFQILEHVGGRMPDLRASALVAKAIREALMSGYRKTVGQAAVPSIVSGHSSDGSPLTQEHLAIAPLAFLGTPHADGRVLGFALIPPGNGELLDDPVFQGAIREIATWNDRSGRRELQLVARGFDVLLSPSPQRALTSLDPAPYFATATVWATCTPIVLDKHLKAKGNAARDIEVRELVASACRNIGLPSPASIQEVDGAPAEPAVVASKHSAVIGAPSAYPSGHAPSWTGWRVPKSSASRQLTHAVLQFEKPIRGPVILGAGRFTGMGLCRALDFERGG
jgi:CRISPR-associated protein Csb2